MANVSQVSIPLKKSIFMSLNIESIRNYCLAKPGVEEGFPFDEETLVFKVYDKMFLLMGLGEGKIFNVKCDHEKAIALREQYTEVQPGYHMNKKHWNTVSITGRLTDTQLLSMIDDSYDLIVQSLPKHRRP